MIELKPCPFCGDLPIKGGYNGDQISCPKCHIGVRIKLNGCQYALHENENEYEGYEAVYKAIKIWNRRTGPMQSALSIDELRKMVGKPVWIPELNSYAIVKCDSIGKWANVVFVRGTDYSYGKTGSIVGVDFEYNVESRAIDCYPCKIN